SLVRPLATGMNLKIRSDDGLAYGWNSPCDCYQIGVDAADDNHWLLPGHCDSPQMHNTATGSFRKTAERRRWLSARREKRQTSTPEPPWSVRARRQTPSR